MKLDLVGVQNFEPLPNPILKTFCQPYLSYTSLMFSWSFRKYDPNAFSDNPFDNLLKIFKELLMFSSGNVSEALGWLTQLDKQYNLTKPDYGIADFIREMKEKGYLKEDGKDRKMMPAAKMELELRRKALDDVF